MEFDEFLREWRGATPYITAHTSGSTGSPKEIRLDKSFVRGSAERTNAFFGINDESRLHSCVAADYIGGKMMAVRADIAGCKLTWEKPSNRPLAGMAEGDAIDLLAVVPSQMVHILDHIGSMPRLSNVIVGGSSIDSQLKRRIAESGINAYETYGMTETASHIALCKIDGEYGCFETLPGITVDLDDRGCLLVIFTTGERLQTNDLAETYGHTRFRINGRYDHIIITGGKKVNPFEVERKLSPLITGAFVVTSRPDMKWGSKVVLIIEGDGYAGIAAEELRQRMRELLEPHEVPKEIDFANSLPRTPNGKIKR